MGWIVGEEHKVLIRNGEGVSEAGGESNEGDCGKKESRVKMSTSKKQREVKES